VERRLSERIDDGESQRRGATRSQRRSRDDLHVQGGGAVWCRGGANSRLDKIGVLIPPEGGLAEDGGGNRSVHGGAR
jgi:hypothetical protein